MISDMIRESECEILHEWIGFARELEGTGSLSEEELLDHGREILLATAQEVEFPRTEEEHIIKSQGKHDSGALDRCGEAHSLERLEQGMDLHFIVAEYRALRTYVGRKWLREGHRGDDAIEDLMRFNEAIDRASVRSASEHARQVNLERDGLEAVLAHDLRKPLTAIRLSADALKQEQNSDKVARKVDRCSRSADKMSRLIERLLDATRLRQGQGIRIQPAAMDLASVVQESVAELQAANAGANLRVECPDQVLGSWDNDRIGQVFSNLITNAIKYGDQKAITINVVEDGDWVRVKVHNHGRPIAPDEVARIFDPYIRAERAGLKSHDGFGLGLHIVKQIVLAHQGDITVTSSLVEGTRFQIALPRTMPSVDFERASN